MLHKKKNLKDVKKDAQSLSPTYGSRKMEGPVPKYEIPSGEMEPKIAYNLIHDELMLDGNSRLNLATFVTTWMEPEARKLMTETFDKNMIDKDEYPQTAEIEMRCVNMLSRLWNSPEHHEATGCSTIGSSEAAMLGGMAMKWRWRERMKAQGKPTDKPNLIMSIGVQICWEKFVKYWDIEPRYVPMEREQYRIDPQKAIELCDENTIGIIGILGITYTGQYEDIKAINDALETYNTKTGYNIPIHVDAASGGFVAPFIQKDLLWDFRLKWVKSINASGHKYGLVYPGVGWIIWRDRTELPKDLIFFVQYLGGKMPTFAINFSRPGNQVVAQYYNFLRLGKDGYAKIHQNCQDTALYLSKQIAEMGPFELVSDGSDIPVFCWKLKEPQENWTLFDMADRFRDRGWLVPAYPMPDNISDVIVERIVVKEGFSLDMANLLLKDMKRHLKDLEALKEPTPSALKLKNNKKIPSHFHH